MGTIGVIHVAQMGKNDFCDQDSWVDSIGPGQPLDVTGETLNLDGSHPQRGQAVQLAAGWHLDHYPMLADFPPGWCIVCPWVNIHPATCSLWEAWSEPSPMSSRP